MNEGCGINVDFKVLCDDRYNELKERMFRRFDETNTHIEERNDAVKEALILRDKVIYTRMDGMDRALTEAKIDLERRLLALDRLSSEISRARDDAVKSGEYKQAHATLEKTIDELRAVYNMQTVKLTQIETRYESRITFSTVLSIFSAIIAVLAVIVPWYLHSSFTQAGISH